MNILTKFCLTMLMSVSALNANQSQETDMAPVENRMIIETNQGNIEVELLPSVAPKACENFTKLAVSGYYDATTFHRVIPGFMIQGGDPTGTGAGGQSIYGEAFEDECTPEVTFDAPLILAMANAGPNTNGSQFFITTAETPWLDMKHTIFGKVVAGKEVVRAIEATKTDSKDKPVNEQTVKTIKKK